MIVTVTNNDDDDVKLHIEIYALQNISWLCGKYLAF